MPVVASWLTWWLLCAGAIGLLPDAAFAQAVAPSAAQVAEEALRRQEERARDLQKQALPHPDTLRHAEHVRIDSTSPAESPCFPITGFILTGPDADGFAWILRAGEPYLHQCAGAQGVARITEALNARLIEFGYVTSRVVLPPQSLKDGLLTFRLHAGRLANIVMRQQSAPDTEDASWGTWRNAFPTGRGGILNARDLEQGIEQMQRVSSQQVSTQIEPGDEPDTSDLRILRRPAALAERVRGGVTLDNSGNRSMGLAQLSAHLSFDNPLGLNDILSLSGSSNANRVRADHRSQSASLQYGIPWGYHTATLSLGASRFAQAVQGTTVRFLSSGSSSNAELRWHATALRTASSKSGVYAAVGLRSANSFLDDVELVVQRRRTTTLETGLTHKQLIGRGSIEFELGHRRGIGWHDAQDDLPTAATGGLTLRPAITALSLSVTAPFELGSLAIIHTTGLRAQYTRDLTLSVDQFAIGSASSVRGFDGEAVLMAESGWAIRNEWSMPIKPLETLHASAYGAIDFGRVLGPSVATLVGDRLAGAAFGLRAAWRSVQASAGIGMPLYRPAGFRTRTVNPYLSLTAAF